ncbi:MAG: hypothetical protein K8T90_12950 [Planctomycetes bacterium]|nr:hypothetical protein [Planctomycetota bacterium]
MKRREIRVAFALSTLVLAVPGCCGLVQREDGPRSLSFLAESSVSQFRADADATARTFGGIGCALQRDIESSAANLATACRLYGGR